MLTTSIVNVCDEREWCTDYGTPNWVLVYFNSVRKRVKQCCCTLILLPKSTLNANLTTTNRFFTNDDWQCRRFENFESDHQYELNLESDVRFEIESNHEASQVPSIMTLQSHQRSLVLTPIKSAHLTSYWSSIVTLLSHFRDIRAFIRRKPLFRTPPIFRPKFRVLGPTLGVDPWCWGLL